MIKETDWAKLAAYIDGEGSISMHRAKPTGSGRELRKSPYYFLTVSVFNTDFRLPVWCKKTFGIGSLSVRSSGSTAHYGKRPGATWRVTSQKAEFIIRGCLEHFVIKREQAELALAYRETVKRWGKAPVSETVMQERARIHAEISRIKTELPEGANVIN